MFAESQEVWWIMSGSIGLYLLSVVCLPGGNWGHFLCCTGWLVFSTEEGYRGRCLGWGYGSKVCRHKLSACCLWSRLWWLYCEVTGQGFTTAVSHREPVLIQPPPPSTAKYYHRMKTRQETPRLLTKAAIMTGCCVSVPRNRTYFRKWWSTGYQAADDFYCVRTAVV